MQNIFKPSFMREYEAFWALSARGERQFDPTWMAQLLCVLACSLQASPELQTPDFLPEDLQQLSRAALDVSLGDIVAISGQTLLLRQRLTENAVRCRTRSCTIGAAIRT